MASALHADFARLRARGIETTLAPPEPRSAPEPLVSAEPPVVPEAPVLLAVSREAPAARPGWLA
jgi:hypothetical protein